MRITGHDVIRAVARHYGLSRAALDSPARYRCVARPRQVAFFIMRRQCPHLSLPAIGRLFGGRDHTTVMHGVRVVTKLFEIDPDIRADVLAIEAVLLAEVATVEALLNTPDGSIVPFSTLCARYSQALRRAA